MERESLRELVHNLLGERLFLIVSNREPYIHDTSGEEIICRRPPSGVTTALDPVMRACGGLWVANGSGSADKDTSDAQGKLKVPPGEASYTLKRVFLSKEEEEGYYYGFSNSALWPLCHIAYTRPSFNQKEWEQYVQVNTRFADAIAEEVDDKPVFIFIQDYHFTLLPKLLKERLKNSTIAQFWHIPWPNPEAFRICPWKEEILEGLLGNDLLGFHLQYHCNNFLDTIDRELESRIDKEHFAVVRGGRTTLVRPFPIGVDFQEFSNQASSQEVKKEMENLVKRFNLRGKLLGVGVDRLDYTKGIPERLKAIDCFLLKHPQYKEKFVFLELAVPSRTLIHTYRAHEEEIDDLVEDINWRHKKGKWAPIILLKGYHQRLEILAAYRLAHVCMVTSLHDGMNLVAKEYVAVRNDNHGVLILSPFTGSARELKDSLLLNPYAIENMADAIKEALEMPLEEQARRMTRLRQTVAENNIYKWAGDIVKELIKLK